MRQTIAVLIAAAIALGALRIRSFVADGRARYALEVQARAMAESIVRAEEARRVAAPKERASAPFEFLAALVAEGRVHGLERAASPDERELWRAGGYLFHVQLLNKTGRPFHGSPKSGESEPTLGSGFELWSWPEDPEMTVLALFYASHAGYLLQGDNGAYAGPRAHPEEASSTSPLRDVGSDGANGHWIVVKSVRE